MAASSTPSSTAASKNITPQATGGFSQINARGGGEGGGQAMSVLLSWHEKVSLDVVVVVVVVPFLGRDTESFADTCVVG